MRTRFWKSPYFLLAIAVVISVGMVEVALRLVSPVGYLRPPTSKERAQSDKLLYRRSSIPGLAYEMVPNKDIHVHETDVHTNSLGMRGPELRGRKEGIRRLAVIGDSYTFGFSVAEKDTYPRLLADLLNGSYEVLNFGVGGYSTRDEAIVFEQKALRLDPEVAIVGYVLNDPEIDPTQPLPSYFYPVSWWRHFHLARLIAEARNSWSVRRLGQGDYFAYLHADPVKWASVLDGLNRIGALARERSIRPVLVIFPMIPIARRNAGLAFGGWHEYRYAPIHNKVASVAKLAGFEVVDLLPSFETHRPQEVMVSPSDAHPNALGHKIAAEALAAQLQRPDARP